MGPIWPDLFIATRSSFGKLVQKLYLDAAVSMFFFKRLSSVFHQNISRKRTCCVVPMADSPSELQH